MSLLFRSGCLVVCLFVSACGQKGALYLPEKANTPENASLSAQSSSAEPSVEQTDDEKSPSNKKPPLKLDAVEKHGE